ncbi:MAG: MFS transporter [Actinobacteria bacterium]|nr:MFS transporter [Actinomycetota bacterium]
MAGERSEQLGKNYWRLWSAHATSNLGDGLASVAFPWLASAVTREPFLIALIAVMSRLPWLVFTLPAGVITDRYDRKKIIVLMNLSQGLLALLLAILVFFNRNSFPNLNLLSESASFQTNYPLYFALLAISLLFGFTEVLRDNAGQTFLPSIVRKEQLESANGKLWSAEYVMNSFVGPPLASFLLGVAIFLPFFIHSSTFFIAAALVGLISRIVQAEVSESQSPINFRSEIKEGVEWLWRHDLLRPMAIILGSMNLVGALTAATFILFAQEILKTSVFEFAVLGTAGAIGGTLGGVLGPRISKRLGSGRSLWLTLVAIPTTGLVIGLSSNWVVAWAMILCATIFAVLWNVITVSLRQSIIPAALLGRVNSVYRFFAWGSMPIGTLIGGAIVSVTENFASRELALRMPYFVSLILGLIIFLFAVPLLTTEKIEKARSQSLE